MQIKITIIGSGYVGLVSGVCFSEIGCNVTCLDVDEEKIESLREAKSPIYEPGLQELLHKHLASGNLKFTSKWEDAVPNAEVIFIAVGTPSSRRGNGYADMGYVYEAAQTFSQYISGYTLVVNKSTVPVGSARQVERVIREKNPKADFDMASNPEFLREGDAIKDFLNPDRIILGVESERAKKVLSKLYEPFSSKNIPLVFSNLETAELIKYASNAFLATKISFINEMSHLCETVGANVVDLALGMGLDRRIGADFLKPGPGYGGSCFPKDTLALIRIAQEHGAPIRIVETAVEVNNAVKARMVKKIRQALGGNETGKTLAVLGLTFKPNTDDMREAPCLTILPTLAEKGLKINSYDPQGMEEGKKILPEVIFAADPYEACKGADAICLMTEWPEFKELDFEKIKQLVAKPVIIDLRNYLDAKKLLGLGFQYIGNGSKQ